MKRFLALCFSFLVIGGLSGSTPAYSATVISTGQHTISALTSWTTLKEESNVFYPIECLAGHTRAGELLVFWRHPSKKWHEMNVSRITGETVLSPLTRWVVPDGRYLFENIAGCSKHGDLLVFCWRTDGEHWSVVNVSQITGQTIVGPVTSWVTTNEWGERVEHLAGHNRAGDLLVFWWQPDSQGWRVENISNMTGQKIASPLTSWITHKAQYWLEYLAGHNQAGELLVFWRCQSNKRWRVENISQLTGQIVAGPLTRWVAPKGPYLLERLAGYTSQGELLVFWRHAFEDWQVANVSRLTGQHVIRGLTSWVTIDGWGEVTEHLAGHNSAGELLAFRCRGNLQSDWQVEDVFTLTGQKIVSPLTRWETPNDGHVVEHFAGHNRAGELLEFQRLQDSMEWRVANILP